MDPLIIGSIIIAATIVLFFLEIPIGIAMLLMGFLGIFLMSGLSQALYVIGNIPFSTSSTYLWSLIPLFVLMGNLAYHTKLGTDLFSTAYKWLGHFPGGLAMTTIGTSGAFGAVCGDNIAGALTMSAVCLPEMRKHRYSDELSLAVVSVGGSLSFLIPPSLGFIIYGIIVNAPIDDLFLAGVFPGIICSILFLVVIYIICRVSPDSGPTGTRSNWIDRIKSLRRLWGVLILLFIVFGGIYSGLITPTEAGAIGAVGAMIVGLLKRTLSWEGFKSAALSTAETTGMIFLLLAGALTFAPFLSLTTIPAVFLELTINWPVWAILLSLLIFYFLAGMLVDSVVLMVITMPIFLPIVSRAGFDLIWFGVIMILLIMVGNITPPVGLLVYAVAGANPEVPLGRIFRGVMKFLPAHFITIVLLIIFPSIATLLPKLTE